MRSTIEIIIAAKDAQPASDQELRAALLVESSIHYGLARSLEQLIEAVVNRRPRGVMEFRAVESRKLITAMARACDTDAGRSLQLLGVNQPREVASGKAN